MNLRAIFPPVELPKPLPKAVVGFDVAAIREALRLAKVQQHCSACEVEWRGGGPCWSCGRPGESGRIPWHLRGGSS